MTNESAHLASIDSNISQMRQDFSAIRQDISALQKDLSDMKGTLGELKGEMPHMATKTEVERARHHTTRTLYGTILTFLMAGASLALRFFWPVSQSS